MRRYETVFHINGDMIPYTQGMTFRNGDVISYVVYMVRLPDLFEDGDQVIIYADIWNAEYLIDAFAVRDHIELYLEDDTDNSNFYIVFIKNNKREE